MRYEKETYEYIFARLLSKVRGKVYFQPQTDYGRPDFLIDNYGRKIVVEVKLRKEIDEEQIYRYRHLGSVVVLQLKACKKYMHKWKQQLKQKKAEEEKIEAENVAK